MNRSGDEIRAYLRQQIDHAVRRLGMYGDELSLILLFDALAYAEGIEELWSQERDSLRERGAFNATGVRGALETVFSQVSRGEGAIGSVYAEFAHRAGWLDLERILKNTELHDLAQNLPVWCQRDRELSAVKDRFGPPSLLLGGSNPAYLKTWLYAGRSDQPLMCFHLWPQFSGSGDATSMLLAARIGGQPFPQAFHFTPLGQELRPPPFDEDDL
jgi:hypothetical protein